VRFLTIGCAVGSGQQREDVADLLAVVRRLGSEQVEQLLVQA